jgi:large subunit ribosomal protein L9
MVHLGYTKLLSGISCGEYSSKRRVRDMKVILKEDVENLGAIGDTVTVRDGYARNYLVPRNLAVEANPRNIKEFEHHKRIIHKKADRIKNSLQIQADQMSSVPIVIKARAGGEEKLFGSVTNIDIEEALKEKGVEIDKKKILLHEPIKRLGEYTVSVKLHRDVTSNLTIQVVREE